MNKKLSTILTIIAGVIGLVGFYFFVRVVMEGDDAIIESADLQSSIVSPFISFATFVLYATGVVVVVFSALNLIKHPEVLKRSIVGLAIMGVLLAVAYAFASDAAVTDGLGSVLEDGEAGSVSKWVSTLINYSFILGAIGLVSILFASLKGIVK